MLQEYSRELIAVVEWRVCGALSVPSFQFLHLRSCPHWSSPRQNAAFLDKSLVMVPLGYCEDLDAIVMELMKGTVHQHLESMEELAAAQVLRMALQVGRPLQHLHQRGVVHCDVKLENYLVSLDGSFFSLFRDVSW